MKSHLSRRRLLRHGSENAVCFAQQESSYAIHWLATAAIVLRRQWTRTVGTLLVVVICATTMNAQDNVDPITAVSTNVQAATDPEPSDLPHHEEIGDVQFYDGVQRTSREWTESRIYPKAGKNPNREAFHRPIFALMKLTRSNSRNPGMATIRLRYLLSSDATRTAAAKVLNRKWSESYVMWAWPVTGRVIVVLKEESGQEIARAIQTVSSRNQIEFVAEIAQADAELMAAKPELFTADFYYCTRQISYGKATLTIEGSQNITSVLRDVVASRDPQLAKAETVEGQIVIADEIANIERRFERMFRETWEIQHPDALPLLEKQPRRLVDKVIEQLRDGAVDKETVLYELNREILDAVLLQYLTPRIKQLNTNRTGDELELRMQDRAGTNSTGIGVSVIASALGVSGGQQSTERTLERLQRATNMTWQYSESERVFKPHELRVARIRKGVDNVTFKEQTVIYVPLTQTPGLLVSAHISLEFTADRAMESLVRQGLIEAEAKPIVPAEASRIEPMTATIDTNKFRTGPYIVKANGLIAFCWYLGNGIYLLENEYGHQQIVKPSEDGSCSAFGLKCKFDESGLTSIGWLTAPNEAYAAYFVGSGGPVWVRIQNGQLTLQDEHGRIGHAVFEKSSRRFYVPEWDLWGTVRIDGVIEWPSNTWARSPHSRPGTSATYERPGESRDTFP